MTQVNRPLSAVERWYWLCDQFSVLNVISRVRVRGDVQLDDLRRGLDELQARHPLLRVRIEHDNGLNPRWLPCEQPIPLRTVRGEHDEQWVDEVNARELVARVDPNNGPLIRAVLVSGANNVHDLLVVVPHIIADGTTVLSLSEQWLVLAADPHAPRWTARVLAPAEDLRPTQYAGEPAGQSLAVQTASDQALMARCRPGRVEPSVAVALDARRTRLLHRELDEQQLEALMRASREQDTTVHGALTAALVLAAARDVGAQPGFFTVGSPIDFRSELQPAVRNDEVGTYVATVPSVVDAALPFWDLARALTTDLKQRKQKGHHFNLVTLVVAAAPLSMELARPFMAFMEAEGPINLCSSNIGRYPFVDRIGAWEVSQAQFLTGISVNGYFVATINSSHGRLFWNFTHIDEAIPANRAQCLADECVRELLCALDQPPRSVPEEQ